MGLFKWRCQCCDSGFDLNDLDWDESEVETCDITIAICPKCYKTTAGQKIIELYYKNRDYKNRLEDLKTLIIQHIEDNNPNSENILYNAAKDIFDNLETRPHNIYEYKKLVNAKWMVICSAFRLFNKFKYSKPKLNGLREDIQELDDLLGWNSTLMEVDKVIF